MALAPSLPVLLAGRLLAATGHGLAMGLAMTTAAAIVAESDRGRAVASVLGGLLTAMFLGAPLGTWLSDLVGWRVVFAGLGAAALVLAALTVRVVPDVPGTDDGGWSSLRPLRRPGALRPMGLTIGILAGGSILFAYLGAYLDEITGLPPSGVALGLAAFGGAGIAGNALGGRMAGRGATRAKLVALWILPPAVLVAGLGGSVPLVVFGALVVWSVAELSIMPVLAHEAIESAGSVAGPVQNAAANAGIALGGLAGAGVVALGGVQATPYAAAAVLGAVALWVSVRQTVANDLARSRRDRMPSLR
jgi:DHA1 family inner membrane transport protein